MNTEAIRTLLVRPIAFHRIFADVAGGVAPGVFLSQLFYWSTRTNDPDGWIYKTQAQWTEETGLKRSEQESARRALRDKGILEEKKEGIPCKHFFRLNESTLFEEISHMLNPTFKDAAENPTSGIQHSVVQDSTSCDAGSNILSCEIQHVISETTTESTTETTAESEERPRAKVHELRATKEGTEIDARTSNPDAFRLQSPVVSPSSAEILQRAALVDQWEPPVVPVFVAWYETHDNKLPQMHDVRQLRKRCEALGHRYVELAIRIMGDCGGKNIPSLDKILQDPERVNAYEQAEANNGWAGAVSTAHASSTPTEADYADARRLFG